MKTLQECVEALRCRTGKANGTTKDGAYWLAIDDVLLKNAGGDGIGQNAPDLKWFLQIRHYRGGEVRVVVVRQSWHQNQGDSTQYRSIPAGDLLTVEGAVVLLKSGVSFGCESETCYSDSRYDDLKLALTTIGLAEFEPGPDDPTV